jgi:NTP pyrophosphatase (non-canonical NTP hydrolase)
MEINQEWIEQQRKRVKLAKDSSAGRESDASVPLWAICGIAMPEALDALEAAWVERDQQAAKAAKWFNRALMMDAKYHRKYTQKELTAYDLGRSEARAEIARLTAERDAMEYNVDAELPAIIAIQEARLILQRLPSADVVPVVRQQGEVLIGCAIHAIKEERQRQIAKWGPQEQVSLFERLAALTEEVGELAEAISETYGTTITHPERGGLDSIRKEAVQVAAVAVAIVEATIRQEEQHEQP